MENKVTISELPELVSVSGTESIPVDSYDAGQLKNKTLRVSVDAIKNFVESKLSSALELKADVKNSFEVVTADKTIVNADAGKTLFITEDCILTVSDYDSLDDGFNCKIIVDADTIVVAFTGSNTVRGDYTEILEDTILIKTPNEGVFVFFGVQTPNSIVEPEDPEPEEPEEPEPGTEEHLILHTQGTIEFQAEIGSFQYSIDKGKTWQENTELWFTVDLPSEVVTTVYIKSNDDVALTESLHVSDSFPNTNNFKGVHQWWTSSRPIRLNVQDNPFYVPKVAPPNVTSMNSMFVWANSFNQDLSGWDVSKVTNMDGMFRDASTFNGDISTWDVSNVTNMSMMFTRAYEFNGDISNWDVSSVTDMSNMFDNANVFKDDIRWSAFNGDLSEWNVSNVTDMYGMFKGASAFNQDLSSWCVSKITSKPTDFDTDATAWALPQPVWGTCPEPGPMVLQFEPVDPSEEEGGDTLTLTFDGASALIDFGDGNGESLYTDSASCSYIDYETRYTTTVRLQSHCDKVTTNAAELVEWGINYNSIQFLFIAPSTPNTLGKSIRSCKDMFHTCRGFNSDISGWNTSKVTDMSGMFHTCNSLDQDLSNWNTSKVTDMSSMFCTATNFNQDLSTWDTGKVTNMSYMFKESYNFEGDVSGWDVSNVTNMSHMFSYAHRFNGDISTWDVSNVTNMSHMFNRCYKFNQDPSKWNTSNVTDMSYMFNDCYDFRQNLGKWNTGNVTDMSYMFNECYNFNENISKWDVSNVTNMSHMFNGVFSFNQSFGDWDVSKVTDMSYMYKGCWKLNGDITRWSVSNVTDMSGMLKGCYGFDQDISGWNTGNVTNMSEMFSGASIFNRDISTWDVSNVNNMDDMFHDCREFNQDLSSWCVSNILTKPSNFDKYADAWTLPKPVWGSCPS